MTLIEDEYGNVDKLAMYNQPDGSILSNIPEGCVVAVKEPYYKQTSENNFMISADHPSDVLLLRFQDPLIPEPLRAGTEAAMTKTAAEWRSVGDAAFIQRDFPTAVFWSVVANPLVMECGSVLTPVATPKRSRKLRARTRPFEHRLMPREAAQT